MLAKVDAGLGVFDDRAVLDIRPDLEGPAGFDLHDVLEGTLPDDGVRADPESGSVVGHSLVEDVLQVGRGPRDAFDPGRCAAEGRVRRLGHGDPLVAC